MPTLRAAWLFVLMHSDIVNGDQLQCDAHTMPKRHRGTEAIFLYYSLSSFSAFSFCVFVILTVLFLFLGASSVCVNNLEGSRFSLVIPWQNICLYTPLASKSLYKCSVPLNIMKLNYYDNAIVLGLFSSFSHYLNSSFCQFSHCIYGSFLHVEHCPFFQFVHFS